TLLVYTFFFFQAEDGIRDFHVTGVQTCALPIFDEPHQFLRSAKLWKAAAVESRKWRLGYIWMFHSWEQIPRDLREIIRAANPHRSEERRVGKESTERRWLYHHKKA